MLAFVFASAFAFAFAFAFASAYFTLVLAFFLLLLCVVATNSAQALLNYRESHPPTAPPLWTQVALMRRMNEVGLLQASNYDKHLLQLSDEGGAFKRKLLGTAQEEEEEGAEGVEGEWGEEDWEWGEEFQEEAKQGEGQVRAEGQPDGQTIEHTLENLDPAQE